MYAGSIPTPASPFGRLCRSPGGVIGSRWGLKIPWPQGRAGSSPALGTIRGRASAGLWHDFLQNWKGSLNVIVFNLGCENSHRFEGWFASSEDYERQVSRKLVSCPMCGTANVSRLPNAAHVRSAPKERPARATSAAVAKQQYANIGAEMLSKLIERIVENTEDVGSAFPEEARKIHYQEAPERRIRGTASRDEVEALKEEGVEVVALPIPAHLAVKPH